MTISGKYGSFAVVVLHSIAASACSGPATTPTQPTAAATAEPEGPPAVPQDKPSAELTQGKDLIQAGKFADALPLLKKAVEQDPKCASCNFYLGVVLEETKSPKEAEAAYKRTLELAPGMTEAAQNLGAIYLGDPPRPDDAIAVLEPAVKAEPKNPRLLQNLGYAYALKKDIDKAEATYASALAVEDTIDMRLALGQLLFDNKRFDKATVHLKAAADKSDDPAVLATVARMMGFMKGFDDCVKLLDKAISKKADSAELFVRRGTCKHELKDEVGASDDFKGALKVDPNFQAAHYYLGVSMLLQKKPNDAKAALKKAYELGKDTPVGKLAKERMDENKWK